MNDPEPPSLQPPPPKRRKGCLFYGCLTLAIVCLAVLVGGGLGGYFLYKKVEQYAAPQPMELPAVHYTEIDKEQFKKRLKAFADSLSKEKPTVPLVLKGEDLNLLLASSDELKVLADGVRLNVDGDQIKGMMSLRLGDLGVPFLKDHYLNGEASFQVSLTNGKLKVSADKIVVNGKPLPEEYLAAMREQNLAENADQNPDVKKLLDKLDKIEVKDGVVKVVPKSAE